MEEGKERGGLLPGFQVCVNPFPAISQLTGNCSLKVINKHSSRNVNRSFVQLSGL